MKVRKLSSDKASASGVREPYARPHVTIFGAVGRLTQAGSSGMSELMDNGMGMTSCSGSKNQQTSALC